MSQCPSSGPDPTERVRQIEAESETQRRRLEHAGTEELERVLRDPSESTAARQIALEMLFHRFPRPDELRSLLVDWLADLMEDPDPAIAEMALRSCPLKDEHVRARVRALLDSPRDRVRAEAAVALARAKDESILPRLLEWFSGEPMRNVAIEGLKTLNTPEARSTLEASYEAGGHSENDKTVLAIALLRLGDTRGLPFLETVARRAEGPWSVTAASWIYDHQPTKGLELLLLLLDEGDAEAQRSVVSRIWNWGRPRIAHPFSREGIAEARAWIEERMKVP